MDTNKCGYVYVLQMEGHPYFKIGRTVNLTQRFAQISPQMPGKLIVIMAHRVRDAWRMEKTLHDDFRDRRMNGEWFQLDGDCLAEVKAALLCDQANLLLSRVTRGLLDPEGVEPNYVERCGAVISKSARRFSRRFSRYSDLAWARQCLDVPEIDTILEAEIIG